jgi:transposase-like protein
MASTKTGQRGHGNQNYKCHDCGRQFVDNPKWRQLSDDTKAPIQRMLLEKVSLHAVCMSVRVGCSNI